MCTLRYCRWAEIEFNLTPDDVDVRRVEHLNPAVGKEKHAKPQEIGIARADVEKLRIPALVTGYPM